MDVRTDTSSIAVKRALLENVKPVTVKTRSLLPEELVEKSGKEPNGNEKRRRDAEDATTEQVEVVSEAPSHADDGEYHILDAMA